MKFGKNTIQISYNLLPALILGICSICLLIRSFYSFSWSDESFYLTVVHRFWLGERILVDEWFFAQVWGPLRLPLYALYRLVTGGNEGVYLYFRLLYWGISTFTAWCTYNTLQRQNSRTASLLCALVYFLYSRANIGGMSYYNMTLTWVLLGTLLFYEQVCEKKARKRKLYVTGILLAFAVGNTPYLALLYVILGIYLLVRNRYRFLRYEIMSVIAGTATVAVAYVGYILYKSPLNEIILSIPHILNEPEMQHAKHINLITVVPVILIRIIWRYKWTIWISGLLMIYIRHKKRRCLLFTRKEINFLLGIDLLVFACNFFLSRNMLGCINIAGVLFAMPIISIFQRWKDLNKNVVRVFGAAGISLTLAFSLSSDTGLDAMAIGFVVINMGVILLVFHLDELQKKKIVSGIVLSVYCVMIFQTAFLRFFSVYRDAPFSQLDTQITSGVGKYLFTTQEHAKQYNNVKTAIDTYVRENDQVLYSQNCFWGYLCTDNAYGTPSSWRMPFNSPRLKEYYEVRPEKIPTCIFVLNPAYGNFESDLIQGEERAELPNANKIEGYLADYIAQNDYEKIELECATIFRRK